MSVCICRCPVGFVIRLIHGICVAVCMMLLVGIVIGLLVTERERCTRSFAS